MLWPIKVVLGILRAASEAILLLEAQRLVAHFIRPTSLKHVARAEDRLLEAGVTSSTRHIWVKCGSWKLHTIVAGEKEQAERRRKWDSEHGVERKWGGSRDGGIGNIAGGGKVMVLLHGHSMSGAFYYRNLDDMVAMGYMVYAVDLLGWGRSDRPVFEGKIESMLEWYLETLERWRINMGISDFVLVGHSLGAYLAATYANRFQERVAKLVLICPAAIVRDINWMRALYFKVSPHTITRRGGLLGWLMFFYHYPNEEMYVRDCLRLYCYHLSALPASGDLSVSPMIRFARWNKAEIRRPLIENLGQLPMPIQLICGETDSSMPVEDIHFLYKFMLERGYQVQLQVIKGADHCPHLEDPDAFNAVMSRFARIKDPICTG